jgi:serine/threonine protein kinase
MIHPDRRYRQRRRQQQQRSLGGWREVVSIYYFLLHFWYRGGEGGNGGGGFLTEIQSFSVTSTTVRYGRPGTRTPTSTGTTSPTTTGTTTRQSWTTIWTAYHSALAASSSSSIASSSSSLSSDDHLNDSPTVESDGTAVMTTATMTTTTTDDYHQWTVGECIGSGSYGTVHYLQAIPVVMSTSPATVPPTPLSLGQPPPSLPSPQWFVGKRAWKAHEIQLPGDGGEKANDSRTVTSQQKERQSRCIYYWKVEAHCFHKLPRHPQLPPYYGTTTIPKESKMKDVHNSQQQQQQNQEEDDEWMVFGPILLVPSSSQQGQDQDVGTDTSSTLPRPPPLAQSLAHYMELDWQHSVRSTTSTATTMTDTDNNTIQLSQSQQEQRLPNLAKALNCHNDASTLDTLFSSLLSAVVHIHASNIVHRDIKPSNILIAPNEDNSKQQSPGNAPLLSTSTNHHPNKVILIDFGSAADLDPLSGVSSFSFPFSSGSKKYVGLDVNEQKVAVSPLYCAPEIFIDPHKAPLAFDLSSCGLLFCQFIFSYLDERSDAGFRQQLLIMANTDSSSNNDNKNNHWDLNRWLANQLASKVRPEGLEDALAYLGERPGLWTFLQELLQKDPRDRPTSEQALQRWTRLLARAAVFQNDDGDNGSDEDDIDAEDDQDRMTLLEREDGRFFAMVVESIEACQLPTVSRPLHFVATFSRNKPLGLVFSEFTSDDEDDGGDDNENAAHRRHQWTEATKDAVPGEVFIKDIVPGGQADQLGIFEIGDRLQGIGELTFTAGGFEKAVEMLQDQPRSAQNVRLHFDRIKVRDNQAIPILPPSETKIAILDQGVWSTQGRRQTQEDAFGTSVSLKKHGPRPRIGDDPFIHSSISDVCPCHLF